MSGEWVATIACDPSVGICASTAIRPRQDVNDSAASGSSNRYRPRSTTRVLSTWRNAWPWLRAWRSTPPNRSAQRPSGPTAVKSSCIFSALRKKPPFPPPGVPTSRSAIQVGVLFRGPCSRRQGDVAAMGLDMPGPSRRDGFDQSGLATSVFADEYREPGRRLEAVLDQLGDRRDRERPAVHPHLSLVDIDPAQRRPPKRGHRPKHMTRLLSPPATVELTLAADGSPAFVSGALNGAIDPIARWKVETEWWNRLVVREYWKVLLGSELLCELYHDLDRDLWFVERIYD